MDELDIMTEEEENEILMNTGTCQGCGRYGYLGAICVRNGEECGEYL